MPPYNLFMIGRLTRGDEEAGRLEPIPARGIHAPAFAALMTVAAMNAVVAVLTSAALVAEGLPTAASLALGASFAAVGLFFTGVALVAAQITENTRVVYGSSGALVGLAYVMRIVGDIGDGNLSWISPIGFGAEGASIRGRAVVAAAAAAGGGGGGRCCRCWRRRWR